jgi:hypothetical protein
MVDTSQCRRRFHLEANEFRPPESMPRLLCPWRSAPRNLLMQLAVVLLLVFPSPQAFCQFASRPPLTSRPTGIMLIATLESLSVVATPFAAPLPSSAANALTNRPPISITTSWAVPTNLTTIRLTGYLADASQAIGTNRLPGLKTALEFAQTAGETNQAATRIDNLKIGATDQAGLHSKVNSGPLSIVVQAF